MTTSPSGNDSLQRTLRGLELRCPPLPQTLIEALDLIDKPEKIEVGPVTEMVQRDPIVVARLLHTVNSAYYGLRHTISSADRAVVMLGPVAVAGIVLGMHMLKLRSILESPAGPCFQRLIRHSIACAFLTRHLLEGKPGEHDRRRDAARMGVSFTSGLLHDFGKIILVYNFQEEALDLYDSDAVRHQVLAEDELDIERLLFGCDHTEAGEFAARKLNFPDVLVNVIRHHHQPRKRTGDEETDRLIRITAGANLAAKAMGYSLNRYIDPSSIVVHAIWPELIANDLTHYKTPGDLVEDLFQQKEHLDQYVRQLTEGPAGLSSEHDTQADTRNEPSGRRDDEDGEARIWRLNS
ncbi:MAG: HDOD domain-containing protein [Rhodothermales bacterium]